MKKGIAVVIGLGVLIVALLVMLLTVPDKKGPVMPSDETQIYANPAYGFSLRYPAGAIIREGDPRGLYLAEDIDAPTTTMSIQFPRVDTFNENGSHGYYEFQVRVYADPPENAYPECNPRLSFLSDEHADNTAMLAGEPTQIFRGGGAAAGNRVAYTRYGLCHQNRHYSVIDIFASGSDGTPLTAKLEAGIAAGKERNKKIVDSFQFVDSR